MKRDLRRTFENGLDEREETLRPKDLLRISEEVTLHILQNPLFLDSVHQTGELAQELKTWFKRQDLLWFEIRGDVGAEREERAEQTQVLWEALRAEESLELDLEYGPENI